MREELEKLDGVGIELRMFGDFFHFAPEPCLFTDRYGLVRAANPAAAALLGRNPTGKPLAVFVPLGERASFRRFLGEASRTSSWQCSVFSARMRRSPAGLCWTLQ